jgi:hypothetical protein
MRLEAIGLPRQVRAVALRRSGILVLDQRVVQHLLLPRDVGLPLYLLVLLFDDGLLPHRQLSPGGYRGQRDGDRDGRNVMNVHRINSLRS